MILAEVILPERRELLIAVHMEGTSEEGAVDMLEPKCNVLYRPTTKDLGFVYF